MRNIIDVDVAADSLELVSNIYDDGEDESCINFRVSHDITVTLTQGSTTTQKSVSPVDGVACYVLDDSMLRTAGTFTVTTDGITPLEFVVERDVPEGACFSIRLTDGKLYVRCAAQEEEEQETPTRACYAHNLLDNSYFRTPINQRGQTEYSGKGYGLDRWTNSVAHGKVALNNGHASFAGGESGAAYFIQYVDAGGIFAGKVLTAAAMLADGTLVITSGTFPADNPGKATMVSYKNFTGGQLRISCNHKHSPYVQLQASTGKSFDLLWIALYEGEYTAETLPPYIYKGYAAELLECQRYFIDLGESIASAMNAWNLYTPDTRFPVQMRLDNPTVTFTNPSTGTEGVIGQWGESADFEDFADFTYTVTAQALSVASGGGAFTANQSYKWRAAISADL